jgi:hypothetical protein
MILPSPAVPEAIAAKISQIRQWTENARNERFVSIGAVGEAVHVLPGFLDSIEVSSSLLEDNVELEGQSGSVKVVHGWKDCDVSINLILIDIPVINGSQVTPQVSRFDCLAEIAAWFKKMKDGKPQVYTIHHPHIAAWGAREFIYYSLKSSQSREKQIITCTLEFDEYNSTSGKSQERQIGIDLAAQAEAAAPPSPPVDDGTRRGLGELEAQYAKL